MMIVIVLLDILNIVYSYETIVNSDYNSFLIYTILMILSIYVLIKIIYPSEKTVIHTVYQVVEKPVPVGTVKLGYRHEFEDVKDSVLRKSRKERICWATGATIEVGDMYVAHSYRYEGRLLSISFIPEEYEKLKKVYSVNN